MDRGVGKKTKANFFDNRVVYGALVRAASVCVRVYKIEARMQLDTLLSILMQSLVACIVFANNIYKNLFTAPVFCSLATYP